MFLWYRLQAKMIQSWMQMYPLSLSLCVCNAAGGIISLSTRVCDAFDIYCPSNVAVLSFILISQTCQGAYRLHEI